MCKGKIVRKENIALAILVVWIIIALIQFEIVVNNPKRECEKNLPRNQSCVLIAVPEEIKQGE